MDTVVDIQSGGGQLHPMANKDRATNPRRTNRVVTGGCYRCIPRFPDELRLKLQRPNCIAVLLASDAGFDVFIQ